MGLLRNSSFQRATKKNLVCIGNLLFRRGKASKGKAFENIDLQKFVLQCTKK